MRLNATILGLVLAATGCSFVVAQEPIPAPKKGAAIHKSAPPAVEGTEAEIDAEPVVVGNLEHQGWVLTGPRGRHYFFGGLAVADYVYQGERRIVTLQQEEPSPRSWAELAKDFVIMISVSAVIIAALVVMKDILPHLG